MSAASSPTKPTRRRTARRRAQRTPERDPRRLASDAFDWSPGERVEGPPRRDEMADRCALRQPQGPSRGREAGLA